MIADSLGGSSARSLMAGMAGPPQIDWHRVTERVIHL
jgi:hypothetical protein